MAQKLSIFSGRQFLDGSGDPYVGAKLFTYLAGSSTKIATTKDSAGGSNHSNPIILNSRGEPGDGAGASQAIWHAEGIDVKYVLAPSTDTDPPTSAISEWDNIGGINDVSATAQDQWLTGPDPTFVDATSFTLVGDQTSAFHTGRRIKTVNTGGTIYSTIITSAYTSLTTITVVNDSGTLDSGLSAVSYGLLTATNDSIPGSTYQSDAEGDDIASDTTTDIWNKDGRTRHITGTTTITSFGTAPKAGDYKWVIFDDVLTLTHSSNLSLQGNANITTEAGDVARVYADTITQFDVQYFKANGDSLRPLTTRGDIITRDATKNARLAIGTANQALVSDGTDPSWSKITGSNIEDAAAGVYREVNFDQTITLSSSIGSYNYTTRVKMPRDGTVRVRYNALDIDPNAVVLVVIQKNDSTVAGVFSRGNTANSGFYTVDIAVSAGDTVRIGAAPNHSNVYADLAIQDMSIHTNNPLVSGVSY